MYFCKLGLVGELPWGALVTVPELGVFGELRRAGRASQPSGGG